MPWQTDLLKGIKSGEMMVMMAGRRAGKSMLNAMMHKAMQDYFNPPLEGFNITENAVSGTQYYCVEPIGGNWKDMETWTKQTFGEPGDVWPNQDFAWPESPRWVQNNRKFWFRDESDRTLFLMKWS